jgi:hypothetical protein
VSYSVLVGLIVLVHSQAEREAKQLEAENAMRLDDAKELGPDYHMNEDELMETIEAIGDIARESRYSWAEIKAHELNR